MKLRSNSFGISCCQKYFLPAYQDILQICKLSTQCIKYSNIKRYGTGTVQCTKHSNIKKNTVLEQYTVKAECQALVVDFPFLIN